MPKIKIDEIDYEFNDLSSRCQSLVTQLADIDLRIRESQNLQALLTKAKKAYIDELKLEMLSAKSGFSFLEE